MNGSILAERAAALPISADTVREGEVVDQAALSESLRELFAENKFGKRVRVGIANQRTVMRTLELPPVTDRKELAAAVRFQAQDQVPMPLNNAVLDFHPLGVVDTPAGPRQRVVLVAAQRDMVEQLLAAVRAAGLTPEGVDLSAFALIRSLHHREEDQSARVLYLNVDGLTNLAIADGTICRFTRVVGGGLESMAGEIAERRGIPVIEARELLSSVDLTVPLIDETSVVAAEPASTPESEVEVEPASAPDPQEPTVAEEASLSPEDHEAREIAMGYSETIAAARAPQPAVEPPASAHVSLQDVRGVLESGSATSPERCATHSTSTAPRTKAARSHTSCSAARRSTCPASRRRCRRRSASRCAATRSASSTRACRARSRPAACRWPRGWPPRRRRNESRKPDPLGPVVLERRPASGAPAAPPTRCSP